MSAKMEYACMEIVHRLLEMNRPTDADVRQVTKSVCARLSLERMPRKQEILSAAGNKDYHTLRGVLLRKPAKTGSGVAVIALMPKPYACPHGRCTYCPGGVDFNTPNSYTSTEPATLNAIKSGYDPYTQISSKIDKLVSFGHDPSKMELIIVGGTFLFMPKSYQVDFIKSCYDALNGSISSTLEAAQSLNEHSHIRNVGFTIETKPDYCKQPHVDMMLKYGVTRVEIGVQSLQERVYDIVNRGHTLGDVTESFQVARDAGLKIVAHMMPGLPTMTPQEDIADIIKLFNDASLRPDMLKIYPSLVLENTPLYDQYKAGLYKPYTERAMIDILATIKASVPPWVRIMRIQREISPSNIIAGPRHSNLRQLALQEMGRRGTKCRCIRCREPHNSKSVHLHLRRREYDASGGREVFLSYEDEHDQIHGFLRLRKPSAAAHRHEVRNSALVRELHVYGRALPIGGRGGIQHSGLGRDLLSQAEEIARDTFHAHRILIISAIGTREYYSKTGYSLYGPYMAKEL